MKKNKRRKKSQTRCINFIYVTKQTKFITKLYKKPPISKPLSKPKTL